MSSVVAIVKSIVGQVIAVSPEGARRVLIEGDRLLAGEQALTGAAGAVTLELADGRTLDLGRDSQWSADAPDSSTDLAAATAQAAPSVAELQQAIAAGADPSTELEATAAGPSATGAGDAAEGGHSFVMLDATAGEVDPTIGFPTGPLAFAIEAEPVELGDESNSSGERSGDRPPPSTPPTPEVEPPVTTVKVIPVDTVEGQDFVTFNFELSNPPQPGHPATLTVTVGGITYIVPVDASGKGTLQVPNTNTEDVFKDATTLTATVTEINGGNYENPQVTDASATAKIDDTPDTVYAKISIVGDDSVTEGGVLTYKVELVDKDGNPVTVPPGKSVTVDLQWSGTADATDVSSKLPTSVTIDGGSSHTTFPVNTVDDTQVENSETLVATINDVHDNNDVFENLVVGNPNNATGTILDNDSGPVPTPDNAAVLESAAAVGSDVVLVLDRSGSMGPANNGGNGSDPDGAGPYNARIEMLKDAVKNLFASGAVHSVFIVSFSTDSIFHGSGSNGGWFTNLDDALAEINKLEAGGNTDYADALNKVMEKFTPPPPGGGKLVSVFISDGLPNEGSVPESKWIDFLEKNNFDESFAAGFGGLSDSNKGALEPIAWGPGEKPDSITGNQQDGHVLVVDTSLKSLTDMLVSSVSGSVATGDVTSNDTGGTAGWATDGWKLVSVEFDSQVFTFKSADDVQTVDLGDLGTLTIKADGSYTYTAKENYDTATSLKGEVTYTVKDANGNTASSTLTLTVNDRSDPIANDTNNTATLNSTAFDLPTEWRFAPFVDANRASLENNAALKANTDSWQSSSLYKKTLDAQFNEWVLVVTDNNGKLPGDAEALTPVYKSGATAGDSLTFSTTVNNFNKSDSAAWTLYKSTDGGHTWIKDQSGAIDATTKWVTIGALDANTDYRVHLSVNDKTFSFLSENASVTFGDFMVNTPGGPIIEWSATPVSGLLKDNNVWGGQGETATLSVKINGTWVDIPAAGTTITGNYGSLLIKADGSYTYTPTVDKNNQNKTDQFEYKLTQADGDTASAHLSITIDATGPGAGASKAAAFSLLGSEDQDILFTQSDSHTVNGGQGNDLLLGSSNADTFVWKAGDTGNDVIKDFRPDQGDRLDLSELLQGEKSATLDNYLKITTANGESTLQVSSAGKLNDAGGLSNADVTIKLEGVNWANTTINSLVSGADPMIKVDHTNS